MANSKSFFSTTQQIKSHSSALFNERLGLLFYRLDQINTELNTNKDNIPYLKQSYGHLKQVYKNIRSVIRMNPSVRVKFGIETKTPGVYYTDQLMNYIENMIEFCDIKGYSTGKIRKIVQVFDELDYLLRDILQYFSYFIRTEENQKIDTASYLNSTNLGQDKITEESIIEEYSDNEEKKKGSK